MTNACSNYEKKDSLVEREEYQWVGVGERGRGPFFVKAIYSLQSMFSTHLGIGGEQQHTGPVVNSASAPLTGVNEGT